MKKRKTMLSPQDQEAVRLEFDRLKGALSWKKRRDLEQIDSAAKNGKRWGTIFVLWCGLPMGLTIWPLALLLAIESMVAPNSQPSTIFWYLIFLAVFYFISGCIATNQLSQFFKAQAYRLQDEWLATATTAEEEFYSLTRNRLQEVREPF
jgi:hypothetical protein